MEKKIIREKVDFYLNWFSGISIEEIKKDIDDLEKLGAKEVYIDTYHSDIDVIIYSYRMETDEELAKRISDIERKEKYIKDKELAELERLKKKYNK